MRSARVSGKRSSARHENQKLPTGKVSSVIPLSLNPGIRPPQSNLTLDAICLRTRRATSLRCVLPLAFLGNSASTWTRCGQLERRDTARKCAGEARRISRLIALSAVARRRRRYGFRSRRRRWERRRPPQTLPSQEWLLHLTRCDQHALTFKAVISTAHDEHMTICVLGKSPARRQGVARR